jgi:hypothetical protein
VKRNIFARRAGQAGYQTASRFARRAISEKQDGGIRYVIPTCGLLAHQVKHSINPDLEQQAKAA